MMRIRRWLASKATEFVAIAGYVGGVVAATGYSGEVGAIVLTASAVLHVANRIVNAFAQGAGVDLPDE